MKKLLNGVLLTLVAVMILLAPQTVNAAETVTSKDGLYEYEADYHAGTCTVTGYLGEEVKLVVPKKIDGLKVTEIKVTATHHSFPDCVTALVLQEGVKKVALANKNIERISLPDSVEKVLFSDVAIKKITIPAKAAQNFSILSCNKLVNVTIEGNPTKIPENAFNHCISLETVIIENPDHIKQVGFQAFSRCKNLKAIPKLKNVEEIGAYAFCECKSLAEVPFGSRLKRLGRVSFGGTGITKVTIPKCYEKCSDEDEIFMGCQSLKEVVIHSPLFFEDEGDWVFKGCTNLEKVVICAGTKVIPYGAFFNYNNTNLKNVVIPDTVSCIESEAFEGVPNAQIYILNKDCSIDGNAFAEQATVYGYKDSTAQDYCKKNGIRFKALTTATVLKASNPSKGTAKITWKKVSGVKNYAVYRSTEEKGTYKKVGTTTSTSFADKKAAKGKTYYYKVAISYTDKTGVKLSGVMSKPVKVKIAK